MSLSRACILELESMSLTDFESGQKFMRMARRLQEPERKALVKYWQKRVDALK